MKQLEGRVAVVTGAASGIGRALSAKLLDEGMNVVLADVERTALEKTAGELGDRTLPVVTDVADAASVQALADATIDRFGAVHLLVNNAGVSGRFARAWTTAEADWQWVFGVNVWGVINGIRSFVPLLEQQEEGHVVNTGSAACFEAVPGMAAYGASKHAVLAISESLRKELEAAGGKIGVSVFIPGGNISTNILDSERNWPADRLGEMPPDDPDPLPTFVRTTFDGIFKQGADPIETVGAVVEGIKCNDFLICDDPALLREWSAHHAVLGAG